MINRLPSCVLWNKSPIESLNRFYLHVNFSNGLISRIFGCTTFVHVHNQHRDKLDTQAVMCVFLGYSATQKGYKCYDPLSKKWYISADVTFTENRPFFSKLSSQEETSLSDYTLGEFIDLPAGITEPLAPPTSSKTLHEVLNRTTEAIPQSGTHNFPRFSQVYSRKGTIPRMT